MSVEMNMDQDYPPPKLMNTLYSDPESQQLYTPGVQRLIDFDPTSLSSSFNEMSMEEADRESTVFPITATGRAQTFLGEETLVVELSGTSVHHKSEADTIRVIRKKLENHGEGKEYLKHVVDLKRSLNMSGMEIGLPTAFMDMSEPFESQLLWTLIPREYLPLESIRTLDDFKIIYQHVFEAHHWVFEVAGMLHQGPSLNNFFYYYDKAGNVVGVLADWDLASSKEDLAKLRDGIDRADRPGDTVKLQIDELLNNGIETKDTKSRDDTTERRPRYRTGTGPFMALDLLSTMKIVHRYRHDLESFFYILCFFCAQFRPSTSEDSKPYFAYLHGWESGNTKQVQQAKSAFLGNYDGAFQALFKNADDAYLPLFTEWIFPLWRTMFRHVPGLSHTLESCRGQLLLALRENDEELLEENMEEFRSASEQVDKLVVYTKFRQVLFK